MENLDQCKRCIHGEAKFINAESGTVRLLKEDGREITVAREKLCEGDWNWVKDRDGTKETTAGSATNWNPGN